MKLSDAIAKMQQHLNEHGDLEMFDESAYPIRNIEVETQEEREFPAEYNMAEKFVIVYFDH